MSEPTLPPEPVDGIIEPAPTESVDFPDGRPIVMPVGGPPRSRSRRATVRWAVAFVVLALVVGTVSVAASFLAASGTTSAVEGWLPNGTLMYLEARADLPGNQGSQLAGILRKFPGFRDQAQSEMIVDQALTGILDKAGVSWSTDVKPWLGGEVGFAMTRGYFDTMSKFLGDQTTSILTQVGTEIGAEPATNAPAGPSMDDGFVVLASVKDATAANGWITSMVSKTGATVSTSQVGGTTLSSATAASASFSWAVRDNVLMLGLDKTVRAALDTNGKGTLAASADFKAARQAAPGGYLGFLYMNVRDYWAATMEMESKLLSSYGAQSGGLAPACLDQLSTLMPAWIGTSVSAADSSLRFDMAEQAPSGMPATTATNGASKSAAHLPASAVAAIEVRALGSSVTSGWDFAKRLLACDTSAKASLAQVDNALNLLGGLKALIGWAGDTSVGVTYAGGKWNGGLVAVADDAQAAASLVSRLQGLIALGGASSGLTAKSEPYGSGTLLTIAFPGGEIAALAQDGVFYLGPTDFVKESAAVKAGASLADQAGYKDAIQRAGGAGVQDLYVDISAVRGGLEALAGDQAGPAYKTGIQPYLAPFDRLAMVSSAPEGGVVRGHAVLVFK